MASFILHVRSSHNHFTFPLQTSMSVDHIKSRVGELFRINANTFEIQVYDKSCVNKCVLDDEYLEDLHERLPRTYITTLCGEISLNYSLLGSYGLNRYDKEAVLNDSSLGLSSEGITSDQGYTAPEEVSLSAHNEAEPECFEALLITTTEEEKPDVCQSHEFDYMAHAFQSQTHVNQTNLLQSNDEIKMHICYPDTSTTQENSAASFQSNDDEAQLIESTDSEEQAIVQNVTGTNPVESLCTNRYDPNSDDISSHLPDQIAQQPPSVRLSTSLQFVHDVHPYQKTQHNTNDSDKCIDKHLSPYVMRIQGLKTDANKTKSILPRIKIPRLYISLYQNQKQLLSLKVAVVREGKVNDKRFLYTCEDMQFLPDNTDRKAEAVNPIQLNLDLLAIEPDGTFQLSLRLVNNSSPYTVEQSKNRLFYELDEDVATSLHPAPYDPRCFRLACILAERDTIKWDTLCLSDYIRPKQLIQT